MTDFIVLNVAISLVFIYFLLSVFVSGLAELYSTIVHRKARLLRKSLDTALEDKANRDWVRDIYAYPQIKALQSNVADGSPKILRKLIKKWYQLPSYIPYNLFAKALVDVISFEDCQVKDIREGEENKEGKYQASIRAEKPMSQVEDPYKQFQIELGKLNEGPFKTFMYSTTAEAQDLQSVRLSLEQWFVQYSGQISDHYKQAIRKTLFTIALILSLVFNIDTIYMIKHLWGDSATTELLVMQATQAELIREKYQTPALSDTLALIKNLEGQISRSRDLYKTIAPLPLGWENEMNNADGWLSALGAIFGAVSFIKGLGWLISALAMSQGAPFWFDLLNNLINFRKRFKIEDTATSPPLKQAQSN